MTDNSISALFGLSEDHLVDLGDGIKVHEAIVEPFRALRDRAANEGIDLAVVS